MPGNEIRCMRQEFGGRVPIDKIGKYYDQRSAMTSYAEEAECPGIARLNHLRLDIVQRLHDAVYLVSAAARRQEASYTSVEYQQPDIISPGRCHISDRKSRVDGVIQL